MKTQEQEAEPSRLSGCHRLLTLACLQSALIKLAVEDFIVELNYYTVAQHFSILYPLKSDTIKSSLAREQVLDDFLIRSSVNLSSPTWQPCIFWGISKSNYFCFVSSHHAICGIVADLCSSVYHLLAWDLQLDLVLLLPCNLGGNPAQRSITMLSLQGCQA